jgi:hypothetical protein
MFHDIAAFFELDISYASSASASFFKAPISFVLQALQLQFQFFLQFQFNFLAAKRKSYLD